MLQSSASVCISCPDEWALLCPTSFPLHSGLASAWCPVTLRSLAAGPGLTLRSWWFSFQSQEGLGIGEMWLNSVASRVGWWYLLEVQNVSFRVLRGAWGWGLEWAEDQRDVGERVPGCCYR